MAPRITEQTGRQEATEYTRTGEGGKGDCERPESRRITKGKTPTEGKGKALGGWEWTNEGVNWDRKWRGQVHRLLPSYPQKGEGRDQGG